MATLALPIAIAASGSLAALATDSPAEVGQSVAVLLSTRIGERRSEPTYGSRGQLFAATTALAVDTAAIATWEPRATAQSVEVTIESEAS